MASNVYHLDQKASSRMLLHNKWIGFEAPKRGLRDPWKYKPNRPIDEEKIISLITGQEVKSTRLIH